MKRSQSARAAFQLVVIDPAGRIRFGNAQASAWLAEGDTLCAPRGYVAAANRHSRDAFRALVRDTLADAAMAAPGLPRVIPLPRAGRLPLMAIGLPIDHPRPDRADFGLGAAILLRDPEVLELPPARMVRDVFDLTPAEAEVALAMAADRNLKEIAQGRRCSVNTIRTLAGRVFQKMGCRRQSEVVRVIGTLNDVLAAGSGLASGLAVTTRMQRTSLARASNYFDALLSLPLQAPPNQHATIVSRGFAPGTDTGFHLHGCGHEIVCVLEGALTMEYVGQPASTTAAGEAIYVPPGVVHRGLNADGSAALSLLPQSRPPSRRRIVMQSHDATAAMSS
jgi:quercetin dioxygenase-like cupin family protein/DNA-binding CsgD family transcriptional regulator